METALIVLGLIAVGILNIACAVWFSKIEG